VANVIVVPVDGPDGPERLRAKLSAPGAALASVGAIVLAESKASFEHQRLGDVIWPERYPSMKEPFINIAPVVQKAGEGRTPTTDDFRRRPALGGSNSELAQSIAFEVRGDAVEIGTAREDLKPALFMFGGIGRIPITDTTRQTLAGWLVKGQDPEKSTLGGWLNTGKGLSKRKVPGAPGTTRADYASKLAFVFKDGKTELVQGAYPRPFLGFGDTAFAEVEHAFAEWLGGEVAT